MNGVDGSGGRRYRAPLFRVREAGTVEVAIYSGVSFLAVAEICTVTGVQCRYELTEEKRTRTIREMDSCTRLSVNVLVILDDY